MPLSPKREREFLERQECQARENARLALQRMRGALVSIRPVALVRQHPVGVTVGLAGIAATVTAFFLWRRKASHTRTAQRPGEPARQRSRHVLRAVRGVAGALLSGWLKRALAAPAQPSAQQPQAQPQPY